MMTGCCCCCCCVLLGRQTNSTANVKLALDAGLIQPDRVGKGEAAAALCMHQFHRVFAVSRVPGTTCDAMRISKGQRHIVVLAQGLFFVLNVIDERGAAVATQAILSQLKAIVAEAQRIRQHASDDLDASGSFPDISCLT